MRWSGKSSWRWECWSLSLDHRQSVRFLFVRRCRSVKKLVARKSVFFCNLFGRVDYKKYPSLANPNLHYYQFTMNPGDCLFIPALWIHQVRSTHRNIAVNYWLDHQRVKNAHIDPQICTDVDPTDFVTLETIHWPTVANNIEQLKNFMLDLVDDDATSFKQWTREFSKVKRRDDRSAATDWQCVGIRIWSSIERANDQLVCWGKERRWTEINRSPRISSSIWSIVTPMVTWLSKKSTPFSTVKWDITRALTIESQSIVLEWNRRSWHFTGCFGHHREESGKTNGNQRHIDRGDRRGDHLRHVLSERYDDIGSGWTRRRSRGLFSRTWWFVNDFSRTKRWC